MSWYQSVFFPLMLRLLWLMLHLRWVFCCCLEAKGQYLNIIFCTLQAFFLWIVDLWHRARLIQQCIFSLLFIYWFCLLWCFWLLWCFCFMMSVAYIVWANRTQNIGELVCHLHFYHYTHTPTFTVGVRQICLCFYKLLTVSELGLNYNCVVLVSQYEGCAI